MRLHVHPARGGAWQPREGAPGSSNSDPCYPLPRPCPQLSHLQVETRSNKNPLHFWREGQCKAAPFATETRKLQLLCKQDKVLFYRTLLDKSLLRRDANGTVLWRGGTPVCIRIPDEASLKEKARGIFVQLGLNLLKSRSTLVRGESCGSIAADFSAMGLHVDPNCGAVTPHSPRPGNEVRDKEIYKHLQAVYKTHLAPLVHDFAAVWFADLWAWLAKHGISLMVEQVSACTVGRDFHPRSHTDGDSAPTILVHMHL